MGIENHCLVGHSGIIPSRQDNPILSAGVANHSSGFDHARSFIHWFNFHYANFKRDQ